MEAPAAESLKLSGDHGKLCNFNNCAFLFPIKRQVTSISSAALRTSNYEAALEIYTHALDESTGDPRILSNRSLAACKLGK
jgi:hypothetical protein